MQCWPIHLLLFDIYFLQKKISKKTIEIWILISTIPQNILTLHAKKSTLNMTENYQREKKYSVEWSGMSLTCPDLYKAHFSNFSPHFLDITKMGNWWNSKFLKALQVVHKWICSVFCGILEPHFQAGKTEQSDKAHEACCNRCYLYIGKLM